MHDDDLTAALALPYPLGYAVLRHEGGTGILRIGAREMLRNPTLARGTVDPRGLRNIARALRADGQQAIVCADRFDEIAAEEKAAKASAREGVDSKRHSSSRNAERPNTDTDSIPTRAHVRSG